MNVKIEIIEKIMKNQFLCQMREVLEEMMDSTLVHLGLNKGWCGFVGGANIKRR